MEPRHPDDVTPRVEDLFAAGVADMQAAPEVQVANEESEPPPEPAPPSTPVNYTGGTQAKAPDIMHVEGREPRSPAPEVDLVARPTVDLADDDDIAW
ncbi:MAG: hypothetical protein CMA56_03550 [Euryarchaeota archaeon]|nr:hypothetical protein [Euryarchaeota archaeon]|tara:strand:+ start:3506 stop:3796 length:291 start_codon:yes stop_codon:yes gene_type:complete